MSGINRVLAAAIAMATLGSYPNLGAMAPTPQAQAGMGRKSKSRAPQDRGGTRAYQRAALKKRNQSRHRKACRG